MVNEKRSTGVYILLTFITCGIYHLVFVYKLIEDMNTVCDGDGDDTPDFISYLLFGLLTCGIYSLYWYYKVGNRQQNNAHRYDVQISENGTTVIVWMIIGIFIMGIGYWIAMHILIKNMNSLAFAYNKRYFETDANGAGGYGHNDYYSQNDYYDQSYGNNYYGGSVSLSSMNTLPENSIINLRCTAGEFAGNVFGIESGAPVLIGRDVSCNIKLDANTPNVSRRHCTVTNEGGSLYVVDNNSTFGTYLENGTRLGANIKTMINKGSGFYLGNKNICFRVE